MNVLLTGGAGFIGSHAAAALKEAGHRVVAYDNLCKGHPESLEVDLVRGDVADGALLRKTLEQYRIDTVIHFAAFIEAGESCEHPDKYFHNNTMIGLTLLDAMRDTHVRKMVFSSTAAVYGNPQRIPIEEDDRLRPINPYGASKLCVEYMLRSYAMAYEMGFGILRYFNVAGAHPSGRIGEDHSPETHLIPLILQVALGKREKIYIFGDDYDTPDGTCIRDYIHVCDLVDAHLLAAEKIQPGSVCTYNLGNGEGFSVKEVIQACRNVTGCEIPAELAPRRAGDPDKLVASSALAGDELGWKPRYPGLETIVSHAWAWHQGHREGYSG